jgi:hypothetical protein
VIRVALISSLTLAGCAPVPGGSADGFDPDYNGVRTSLLEGDLVQFHVTMSGARSGSDVDDYAECAAAQYALIRGYGFARHVRTTMKQEGGNQTADAVYTISPSLPRGLRTIDAEVVVANCEANGIPTV